MTGNHKTDWNIFYDNGAAENFLQEFSNQATFNFTPGKGFWALSRTTVNVNRQVNTVPLLADNTATINLHTGWNIISNPFEKNVTLADFRNANGLPNAILYAFGGNFTQSNVMAPYEAYYFMNPDGRGTLSIPYNFGTNLPKVNDEPYVISEKNLSLNLSTSEFSSEVKIGIDESSANGFDNLDYFAPPGNFEELNIRLVNNNLTTSYKQLFIEHRPEIGEGQSFDLQIKNSTGKKAKLLAEGIQNFSDDEVYLIDQRLKKFYNLKERNKIEISGSHQNNNFTLLVGKENFINNYKYEFTPTEFALYQNYPNPFNPTTFIRFQVPQKEHVKIKVYDILGNLISTLVNEVRDAGYYEVEFDGTKLSSGVYLYEFESGPKRTIKKMTLLK
jgi:uncharacterized pyridoxamine 5'-phosphate oxidase family protein